MSFFLLSLVVIGQTKNLPQGTCWFKIRVNIIGAISSFKVSCKNKTKTKTKKTENKQTNKQKEKLLIRGISTKPFEAGFETAEGLSYA